MTFHILKPSDREWRTRFDLLPYDQQDVFYSPDFAQLYQNVISEGEEILCGLFTTDRSYFIYPFIKRDLEIFLKSHEASGLYDLTGLYGRGGVVTNAQEPEEYLLFYDALGSFCDEQGVICSFDRFHPIIENNKNLPATYLLLNVGGFVVVDLRPPIENIVKSFKDSVRKDLRKADKNLISCFCETNLNHLEDFIEIYQQTMNRNAASNFYYFSKLFFENLDKNLQGKYHFFYAVDDDEIVSCELVLHYGRYSHSFLGGTKAQALNLCANPQLKNFIISTLKNIGCEYFLLGGGVSANDGIFNFKKAYAPMGVLPSTVGGKIWNTSKYEKLKDSYILDGKFVNNRIQFYDL